jgi:lipopolysaccharide export system permease protein
LKIIIRYTLREMLAPFFLALLAFTSLLLVDKVFDLTKHFVEKGVNPWYMVEMLFYFSPAVLVLTVPMAFLVGIVTAFGRLAADNEITAMKTAGVGMHKLIVPVIITSLILSVFMVFFMDFTLPRGNKAYTRLSVDMQRKHPALILEPDTVMEEMSREGKKWYFKSIDPKTGRMKSIRIWERVAGIPKLTTAEEGELHSFEEWTSLRLYNGTIYQADEKDPLKGYAVGSFTESEMILDISGSLDRERETSSRPRNMSMKEIGNEKKKLDEQLRSPRASRETKEYIREYLIPENRVEFHKKISIPFACLAFGLIGVPVGLMVRRGGRMIGLGVGVGIIILYYVVLTGGEKSAKLGTYMRFLDFLDTFLPNWMNWMPSILRILAVIGIGAPFLGAWTPNILTSVAGIILIIRTVRETPIRSSRLINKLFPPETRYGTDAEVRE